MKSYKIFILAFFICLFGLGSVFATPKIKELPPVEIEPVVVQSDPFELIASPSHDVMFIIARLAGYESFCGDWDGQDPYVSQVDVVFERFRNHPAVKTLQNFMGRGLGAFGIDTLANYLKSDLSGLTINLYEEYPGDFAEYWKNIKPKEIYKLVEQVNQFATDTNFKRIFDINRPTYIAYLNKINRWFGEEKLNEWADGIFAPKGEIKVRFYISVFLTDGWVSDFAKTPEGGREYIAMNNPYQSIFGYAYCYINAFAKEYLQNEFSKINENYKNYHRSYVLKYKNVKPEDYKKTISDTTYKYDIADFFGSVCLLDYIKFADDEDRYESTVQSFHKYYMDDSFLEFYDLMNEYTENREKYPYLKDFWPKLTETLNNLKEVQ